MIEKFKLDYKKSAIMQYVSIALVAIALLLIFIFFIIAIDVSPGNSSEILETGAFGVFFLLPLGIVGALALMLAGGICLILGGVIFLLSTIALILNLHKPSLKKWKVARILNLLSLIIIAICLFYVILNPLLAIILLAIIAFNIYVMYFDKNVKNSIQEYQLQQDNLVLEESLNNK